MSQTKVNSIWATVEFDIEKGSLLRLASTSFFHQERRQSFLLGVEAVEELDTPVAVISVPKSFLEVDTRALLKDNYE